MINKEFGFALVLSDIFTLKSEDDFYNSEYWAAGAFSAKAYNKINNYVDTTKNKFSIQLLTGIFETFAYRDTDALENLDKKIEQIISSNKELLQEIDNICDTTQYLNKHRFQEYGHLAELVFSYEIVEKLANFRLRDQSIFSDEKLNGLMTLLSKLAKLHPKEFKQWFNSTTRKDLKTIYISIVVTPAYFINTQTSYSEIPIIKIYYFMLKFGIGVLSHDLKDVLNKQNNSVRDVVGETYLSEKEKLYFILYYLKYRDNNSKNYMQASSVHDDLVFFAKNFAYLDCTIVKQYLNNQEGIEILFDIISDITNKTLKKQLLDILFTSLNAALAESNDITINDIEKADLYGRFLLQEAYEIKVIEDNFDIEYSIISTPYFVYRNRKKWENGISKLMYYLKIIHILYSNENRSEITINYKDKFINARAHFQHCFDEQFNSIIQLI